MLSLSVFFALNLFDGIEMLEIFLMQKEGDFELGKDLEICIVFFACFCFFLSQFGLLRNKFVGNGEVKEMKETSMFLGPFILVPGFSAYCVCRHTQYVENLETRMWSVGNNRHQSPVFGVTWYHLA